MRVLHVVGARPNFMKAGPIIREMDLQPDKFQQLLVHTGQHYAPQMSQIFFDELDLPKPEVNLDVGSGSHAWQTAQIMMRFEPVLVDFKPDWVVVYGDVNSTLACSIVCNKLDIKVAHVEAGLRSFDRSMPEEINRIVTDQIADLLFTPSKDADVNLEREGIKSEKIHLVGNVMIDSLVHFLPKARNAWSKLAKRFPYDQYVLVTLHRPSNVDVAETLGGIISALDAISSKLPVLFPLHPRTKERIKDFDLQPKNPQFNLLEPLGYLDFLALEIHAALVLTDSGGVQEETTYLGIPCLTARPNTERPVTITQGTNELVESTSEALFTTIQNRLKESKSSSKVPPLWDGQTSGRVIEIFEQIRN